MKTYEELVKENELLKKVNQQLKNQIFQDDITKYPWFGNLGHWYWNFQENHVDFNPLKAQALGYEMEEVPERPGFQFFTEKLHEDDYDRIMIEMRDHLEGKIPVWEVKYRIQAKDGSWRLYYDVGKVTQRGDNGEPLLLAGMVFDITDDKEQLSTLIKEIERWREQAQFDSLTGFYSRSEFYKKLEKLDSKIGHQESGYSLFMFDVDHFKQINDTYGHLAGDKILAHLGKVVNQNLRSSDLAGRYGGDEFIIILSDTDKKEAIKNAQTIQRQLRESPIPLKHALTISGGIVTNDEKSDLYELLKLVDQRLFKAKNQGRNQIVYQ